MSKNSTVKINIDAITITKFDAIVNAAQSIQTLTGEPMPALKLEEVEETMSAVYAPVDYQELALAAVMAGDAAAARKHVRSQTLSAVRDHNTEQNVISDLRDRARETSKEQDLPLIGEYISTNVEKAREKFNQHAERLNELWNAEEGTTERAELATLTPVIRSGIQLQDTLQETFGLHVPEFAHPMTVRNFYPYRKPSVFSDIRTTNVKLIDYMEAQGRPNEAVQLYWKSAREFLAEQALFEKLIKKVGSLENNDIKIYEFWLEQA